VVLQGNVSSVGRFLAKKVNAGTNRMLAPLGLEISRISATSLNAHDWGDVASYIPFAETITNAEQAGLPLGDYIDTRQGIAGAAQAVIDQMKAHGVFDAPILSMVEIGPGTGRYLEKTLRECSPNRCEVYETAVDWAHYIAETFPVIVQQTDGVSLQPTPSGSIDLVQAHKVFSATPFSVTARYWLEMLRVTKPGAHIVFDVVTENCLSPGVVEAWAQAGMHKRASYPAALPYEVVFSFFAAHGAKLLGTFRSPMPPGETEVFVFRTAPDHVYR
jgi:hypothetical protein